MRTIDHTNDKFGKLTVIKKASGHYPKPHWLCLCECGNEKVVSGSNLRTGGVKSCGCIRKENGEKRRANLVGKKYGMLTITKRHDDNPRLVDCICDCGNTITVFWGNLTKDKWSQKHCGCNPLVKKGEAAKNRVITTYKIQAARRGYTYNLSFEYAVELTSSNCHYCGCEPHQDGGANQAHFNGRYIHNGIDRIDNSKGYELGNVVPCCGTCNHAKRTMGYDEFLDWISKVYNHSAKEKTA